MDIEKIISKLEYCKQVAPEKWLARCPSHNDKSPSLSIRDNGDRILINCFAGCGALDVLNAIGCDWADVMPKDDNYSQQVRRNEKQHIEQTIVEIAQKNLAHGVRLSEADKQVVLAAKIKLKRGGE